MLDFRTAAFRYDPYPIGLAHYVFSPDTYEALVATFPDESSFVHMTGAYDKFSLSERNNLPGYLECLRTRPMWNLFHQYVKGPLFVKHVFATLAQGGVSPPPKGTFTSRFEFSSLPAQGGRLDPHTDIPSKVVTVILPMVRVGEWDDQLWGGGTDMLRPLDPWRRYVDYKEARKDFEVVESFAYAPNRAVIFIKTFNSWHSVGPIAGPAGLWRRTVTINIEWAGP